LYFVVITICFVYYNYIFLTILKEYFRLISNEIYNVGIIKVYFMCLFHY